MYKKGIPHILYIDEVKFSSKGAGEMSKTETIRETSVIIPFLITVLFQIKTLVTCVK